MADCRTAERHMLLESVGTLAVLAVPVPVPVMRRRLAKWTDGYDSHEANRHQNQFVSGRSDFRHWGRIHGSN